MSRIDLARTYREACLSFVWRQWGQMGVSASIPFEDRWCQDPEALLLFSLEIARWEPRIFDEILDWLTENGQQLMRQRINNLGKVNAALSPPVIEAALDLAVGTKVESRIPNTTEREALFLGPYSSLTEVGDMDPVFLRHGLLRPRFQRSRKSRPPELSAPFNLAFRLRAVFGASSRSEALRYLLVRLGHEAGTSEIADAAKLSRYGVQQALEDLADARVIMRGARSKKDRLWWLEGSSWLAWLQVTPQELPVWVDWPSCLQGLAVLWRWSQSPELGETSPYLAASRAREVMQQAIPLLVNRGLAWKPSDPSRHRGDAYWAVFEHDLRTLAHVLQEGKGASRIAPGT